MEEKLETKRKIIRVDGKLREIVTVFDKQGKVLQKIMNPIMLEFYSRDFVQIIIGASLLAVPVGFTEETWRLGDELPYLNIVLMFLLSISFISVFVYYNYYRNKLYHHWDEFLKRVFITYFISFLIVGVILAIIQKGFWSVDLSISLKRSVLITFPASMSAAVADMIK